jgi:hypothetical protein
MNDTKDSAITKWMSQLLTQRFGSGLEIEHVTFMRLSNL